MTDYGGWRPLRCAPYLAAIHAAGAVKATYPYRRTRHRCHRSGDSGDLDTLPEQRAPQLGSASSQYSSSRPQLRTQVFQPGVAGQSHDCLAAMRSSQ
jgi:hypothetical protein